MLWMGLRQQRMRLAEPGYDIATGLGSLDVARLLINAKSAVVFEGGGSDAAVSLADHAKHAVLALGERPDKVKLADPIITQHTRNEASY